jgi:hypothetical protein
VRVCKVETSVCVCEGGGGGQKGQLANTHV